MFANFCPVDIYRSFPVGGANIEQHQLTRPFFRDKKCALIGLSAGDQGAGLALSHFTDILNYCGTNVLAYKLRLPRIGDAMTDNKITKKIYLDKIHKQAKKLVDF